MYWYTRDIEGSMLWVSTEGRGTCAMLKLTMQLMAACVKRYLYG